MSDEANLFHTIDNQGTYFGHSDEFNSDAGRSCLADGDVSSSVSDAIAWRCAGVQWERVPADTPLITPASAKREKARHRWRLHVWRSISQTLPL